MLASLTIGINSVILGIGGWAAKNLYDRMDKRITVIETKIDKLDNRYVKQDIHQHQYKELKENQQWIENHMAPLTQCKERTLVCERRFDDNSKLFEQLTTVMQAVEEQNRQAKARDRIMLAAVQHLCHAYANTNGGSDNGCSEIDKLIKKLNWEDLK